MPQFGTIWLILQSYCQLRNSYYYKLEYRPIEEHDWRFLVEMSQAVTDATLIEWHTYTVPPGKYELRLTVIDQSGNYPEPCIYTLTIQ